MAGTCNLEPTAALVMIWARDLYATGSAARFYSLLDLSAGQGMKKECDEACPWYGQVILNRKWCIRHLAHGFIESAASPCQVIMPAAGKSPLALELLDSLGDRIASVIEIDISGMEEKHRLYERAAPSHAVKIRCITADLSDLQATAGAISDTGLYDPDLPTYVVTEGISYYLPPAVLSGIVSLAVSEDQKNGIVLDYLLPCRLVSKDRRRFPQGIWRIINRDCNPGITVTYSPAALEQTLARAGCGPVLQYPLHDIELQRTGTNRYFPAIPDGWIRIAEGRL